MRVISIVCCLIFLLGCKTASPAPPPIASKADIVCILLETSTRFNTFNIVRTNQAARVLFTNAIHVIDSRINTTNCDTITLKKELESIDFNIAKELNGTLILLQYYSTNTVNCNRGLVSLKRGIEFGLTR